MKTKYIMSFFSDCYDLDGGMKTFRVEFVENNKAKSMKKFYEACKRILEEEREENSRGGYDYKAVKYPEGSYRRQWGQTLTLTKVKHNTGHQINPPFTTRP